MSKPAKARKYRMPERIAAASAVRPGKSTARGAAVGGAASSGAAASTAAVLAISCSAMPSLARLFGALNDVESERALHDLGDLTDLELERGRIEGRHHLPATEA